MSVSRTGKIAVLLFAVLSLATPVSLLALRPGVAEANGSVVNFVTKTAGPYEVSLGTSPPSPSVGNLHLALYINETETGALVTDAVVIVTGTGPEAAAPEIGPLQAVHMTGDTRYYDINTSVDREGTWTFVLDVNGPAGQGSVEYQIDVVKSNPVVAILTVLFLVVLVAIIAFAFRSYFGKRKAAGATNGG